MFSLNRDTASIAVALLVVAMCYYLFMEVKKQKGDIERCKTFSIELAQKVHQQPQTVVMRPPQVVGEEEPAAPAVEEEE